MADDEDDIIEDDLEELMDDIEIEDELHGEEKVRKKNAKVLLISIVGLLTIAGVYFGINYYNVYVEEEELIGQTIPPVADNSGKETLPTQENIKKAEKKDALPPQKADEKEEEKKISQQKETTKKAKKKDTTTKKDIIKKTEIKKSALRKKTTKKTEQVNLAKAQIREKNLQPQRLPKDLKKTTDRKKTKPPALKKKPENKIIETYETGNYYIQLGVFAVKKNADNLTRSLKNRGFSPFNDQVKDVIKMYRVYAGKFSDLERARDAIYDLENAGITATLKRVTDDLYTLLTGSFSVKGNAEKLKDEIAELGLVPKIVRIPTLMSINKVYIGYFKTKKNAVLYQQKLSVKGFSKTLILGS